MFRQHLKPQETQPYKVTGRSRINPSHLYAVEQFKTGYRVGTIVPETQRSEILKTCDKWFHSVWYIIHYIFEPGKFYNPYTFSNFLPLLIDIMPCEKCTIHFKQLLNEYPLKVGMDLGHYAWTLHDKVNQNTRKNTYPYESFKQNYKRLYDGFSHRHVFEENLEKFISCIQKFNSSAKIYWGRTIKKTNAQKSLFQFESLIQKNRYVFYHGLK